MLIRDQLFVYDVFYTKLSHYSLYNVIMGACSTVVCDGPVSVSAHNIQATYNIFHRAFLHYDENAYKRRPETHDHSSI